jgi:hypothetical protein
MRELKSSIDSLGDRTSSSDVTSILTEICEQLTTLNSRVEAIESGARRGPSPAPPEGREQDREVDPDRGECGRPGFSTLIASIVRFRYLIMPLLYIIGLILGILLLQASF